MSVVRGASVPLSHSKYNINMAERNFFQRLSDSFRGEEKRYNGDAVIPFLSQRLPFLSKKGLHVGQDALQLTAVYAAVSKVAQTIASMEATVVKVEADGSTQPLANHPVTRLIGREPNPYMTAFEFWESIISDSMLYGSGHAHFLENGEVYYIPAPKVAMQVDELTGRKYYNYEGSPGPVPMEHWMEIRAFRGLNPTQIQYQNLNTQKAIQDFGTTFFEQGGMLGGLLSTKEPLSPEQVTMAANMWDQQYSGSSNAHKVAILGGGFTFQPLSVPLDQLQWSESREFNDKQIARMFGVPPAMLGMDSNTAYSNYEQQVLQFHQGCILPWVRRIEQEINRKMLFADETLQAQFNVDTLLRADMKTRSDYFSTALAHGWMTTNEVRSKEGMGPADGGDVITKQVNQIPLSSLQDYADSLTNGKEDSDNTQNAPDNPDNL